MDTSSDSDSSSSGNDNKTWVIVDGSSEGLAKVLQMVIRNQMEMSHSMQRLLSEISSTLESVQGAMRDMCTHIESGNVNVRLLKDEVGVLQEKLVKLEDRVCERDVRAVNRNIRSGVPFAFTVHKTF